MVELIQDGNERDVLVFTDDAQTASKLRKAFEMHGAVYSGRAYGYSWRVSARIAFLSIKRLGYKVTKNEALKNMDVTRTIFSNCAQVELVFQSKTEGRKSVAASI